MERCNMDLCFEWGDLFTDMQSLFRTVYDFINAITILIDRSIEQSLWHRFGFCVDRGDQLMGLPGDRGCFCGWCFMGGAIGLLCGTGDDQKG